MAGEASRAKGEKQLVLTRGELYTIPSVSVFLTKQYQIPRGGWMHFADQIYPIPAGKPFVVHVYLMGTLLHREIWIRGHTSVYHTFHYPLDALKEAMITICERRSENVFGEIALVELVKDAKLLAHKKHTGPSNYGTW